MILAEAYLTDPEPHRPAVHQAVRWLSDQATIKAATHHDRLRHGPTPPTWDVYDTITGLAGIGRILLAALTNRHHHAEPGLNAALTTLTTLINTPASRTRPGWWLPAEGHPSSTGVPPSGVAETGMAHGIAGPMALLSIASSAGWEVNGQAAAIRAAARWLVTWRTPDTTTWPPYITGHELDSGPPTLTPAPGRRDAWCYGAPGIGRALTLAGHALSDPHLTQAGDLAIASLASRPANLWDTEGLTLCHGSSGVLQCASTRQSTTADAAAATAVSAFDGSNLFAVRHVREGTVPDDPGLLTGVAGVALALADLGTLPTPTTTTQWDAVLLLS
ncbi:lanthionine synthetase LanC family protein [Nonomuraea salmonea]